MIPRMHSGAVIPRNLTILNIVSRAGIFTRIPIRSAVTPLLAEWVTIFIIVCGIAIIVDRLESVSN
jgi:hypothetical protein